MGRQLFPGVEGVKSDWEKVISDCGSFWSKKTLAMIDPRYAVLFKGCEDGDDARVSWKWVGEVIAAELARGGSAVGA